MVFPQKEAHWEQEYRFSPDRFYRLVFRNLLFRIHYKPDSALHGFLLGIVFQTGYLLSSSSSPSTIGKEENKGGGLFILQEFVLEESAFPFDFCWG